MLKVSLLAAAGFALFAVPAFAQEEGTTCYATDSFFVVGKDNAETAGTQFRVLPKASADANPQCNWDAAASGALIGDVDDPLWFAGIGGKFLVLTRSTGPVGDIVIYDLATTETVVDATIIDDEVDDTGVTYWAFSADATAENCPTFAENEGKGLGSVITAESRFDYATGTATATGQTRCDATQ